MLGRAIVRRKRWVKACATKCYEVQFQICAIDVNPWLPQRGEAAFFGAFGFEAFEAF